MPLSGGSAGSEVGRRGVRHTKFILVFDIPDVPWSCDSSIVLFVPTVIPVPATLEVTLRRVLSIASIEFAYTIQQGE